MTYKVFALKWRPRTFEDMIGQSHVLKTLSNALEQNRLHHAYIFTGTRGVGKTTLARILAKCLNCEEGVTSTPCGKCHACIGIDEGRFVDLVEVDAASRARVEETRELMANVQYAPSNGRYKVYLIDEIHMFSNHSFNALLKTLEEPPPHVKFLLATTEPKKLPITILSRCLQFNLTHLTQIQIVNHIKTILHKEELSFDDGSVELIARYATGSMRDALSLLDQAIAHGNGQLKEKQVSAMIGTVEDSFLQQLLNAIFAKKAEEIFNIIDKIAFQNPDFSMLLSELTSLLQKIAIIQVLPDNSKYLSGHKKIIELAKNTNKEDVQLYYQIAIIGKRDLYLAPDMKSGFEMVMARMLAFCPVNGETTGKNILSSSVQSVPKINTLKQNTPEINTLKQNTPEINTLKQNTPEINTLKQNTPEANTSEINTLKQNTPEANTPIKVIPESGKYTDTKKIDEFCNEDDFNWKESIEKMELKGLLKELAGHCILKLYAKNQIKLSLSKSKENLLNPIQKQKLEDKIKTHLGSSIKLSITIEDITGETPAESEIRHKQDKQKMAENSILTDLNVDLFKKIFDAKVDDNSILPKE